ncbi:mycofactocin biosynthesis glycosyltransferase MftF [Nocardia sp. NPDC005978]|uniref:mycofactocin biosynthesis glycosyltransferase MftF n=1 Tax=Nocardia sp. NPDC005978 TaxID=3156725 RepID=UPI0033B24A60
MRVLLDSRGRRFADGRGLLGGSPPRLMRLGASGARVLDSWLAGHGVSDDPAHTVLARRLLDAGIVHPTPEPNRFARHSVTIVIPVRDNAAGLARLTSTTVGDCRCVIVDDGSRIPLPDATARHRVSRGPAAARNTGVHGVETALVAFLDSDTIPAPDWLDTVVPLFEDPAVAAVAPRVRSLPDGPIGRYESRRSALDMGERPATVRPDSHVRYVPSAALVVRVDALRAVGGFDERLRFGEDVDLVWRLVAAGHTVRYQPDSIVHHEPRASLIPFLRQRFDYGTSAAPLSARHPEMLAPAILTPATLAQFGLAMCGFPAAALAPSLVSAAMALRTLRRGGVPMPIAAELVATGQLTLARQLAAATRRTWWPLLLWSPRGRTVLRIACAVAALESAAEGTDPALRLADDAAYALGVWAGCARTGTWRPMLPRMARFTRRSRR